MDIIIEVLVGMFLLVIAIVDIKYRAIPSFITTAVILALILIIPENLIWGISGFVFGWMLYEFDFLGGKYFGGIADVKVMGIIGFFVSNIYEFAVLMVFIGTIGIITSIAVTHFYKKKGKEVKEIPYLPVLFIVYCILLGTKEIIIGL